MTRLEALKTLLSDNAPVKHSDVFAWQWQDISTAPDGVLLLFCSMTATELRDAFYVDWVVGGRLCSGVKRAAPTHWVSLPDYPKDDR